MKDDKNAVLVYSSEAGRVRQDKRKSDRTGQQPAAKPADGIVRLRREVKGRGGGTVIVITGIPLPGKELTDLAGALKKRCGCGGTVKQGVIEIQGDHRDTLLQELQARGFKVKLAGG
ncbi:stress response translation initiation inhibitor YciH [Geobacter sp. SVR]|uniref:stress response translation initiation inhibitor YciH n=1 Tax=Geobacter sp. SVR TaxID=2495594 RepID=UPI00143F006D|nr:stress response translation initiation inhibitor YciH [Geobacter sp. SVR]BCS53335.1 translation initiation factor [Geobacter sp. SVR]GCF85539.1 translation initiation factor [Geobacter sp. SVR]